MKPLQTTVREVLTDAIQSEVETRAFYQALAEKVSSPALKRKVLDLADRELMHRARLERRFYETIHESPPEPATVHPEMPHDAATLDLSRILKLALERERESESNYRFLAERVPNSELGTLFMDLAEIEWKHKIELQQEYDESLFDPERFLDDL